MLSEDVYYYDETSRSYYALNVAVTADNYEEFLDSTVPYAPVANQLDATAHPEKTVWLDIYNAADNFLSATYQPLLQNYDDLLNLKVDYIGGDGQTEANITNRLGNPSAYDASPSTWSRPTTPLPTPPRSASDAAAAHSKLNTPRYWGEGSSIWGESPSPNSAFLRQRRPRPGGCACEFCQRRE